MIKRLFELMRLMVGVPDYDRFVAHQRAHHPEVPIISRAAFIAERQQARYGGKSQNRCC